MQLTLVLVFLLCGSNKADYLDEALAGIDVNRYNAEILDDEDEFDEIASELASLIHEKDDEEKMQEDMIGACSMRTYPLPSCAVTASATFTNKLLKESSLAAQSKVDLARALHKREVCLKCGESKSWKETDCDDIFWLDAKSICQCKYKVSADGRNLEKQQICLLDAAALRNSRQIFKDPPFIATSPSFCNNDCIKWYGPAVHMQL